MAETMEQYMSKTRADYGSGVARPKIKNKDNFELKRQFLKELRTNTFRGSDHEDANEHIEKVLEIVDLFHIPNITIDQVMLRAFPMSLTGAASRWLRSEPTAIQAQLNNLGREIKKVNEKVYVAQVGCEQWKGPHYTKDCQLKEEGKTLEEAYYTIIPSSTKMNPGDQVKSISTTIKADSCSIRRIGSAQYAVSTGQSRTLMYETRQTTTPFLSHLNGYYCEDEKGSYGPQYENETHDKRQDCEAHKLLQKACILKLKRMKIIILTLNTPYPSRKIRRIRTCTHKRPQRKEVQYAISREDQYAVFKISCVIILEDVHGPYSKKLQYIDEVPPKSKNDMPLQDK
nr:hypothetical protein [Tanacetum cinerariifolium]